MPKAAKKANTELKISELDDETLVKRFSKKSCKLSFEELVSRYQTKCHNLAMRLTRNAEDAEEVLQDVFVTVYRKIDSFQGKSKFSSWLYRITVNAAFMKLRKRKNAKNVSLEDAMPTLTNTAIDDKTAFGAASDSLAINNEIKDALEGSIKRLPEEYRAVFVLRDIDGLSNKEVGDILGLSIPAVKSRLHRSRLMLRKKLKRFYEDYSNDSKIIYGPKVIKKAA